MTEAWSILPREISNDVKLLYQNGTATEKLLCISFLKSVDLLFIKDRV